MLLEEKPCELVIDSSKTMCGGAIIADFVPPAGAHRAAASDISDNAVLPAAGAGISIYLLLFDTNRCFPCPFLCSPRMRNVSTV